MFTYSLCPVALFILLPASARAGSIAAHFIFASRNREARCFLHGLGSREVRVYKLKDDTASEMFKVFLHALVEDVRFLAILN